VSFDHEERYNEAIAFIKKAIKLEEEDADYWYSLADVYAKINDTIEADRAYAKAVQYDPMLWEAWLDWSLLKLNLDERQEAIDLLDDALQMNPEVHQIYYRQAAYHYMFASHSLSYEYLKKGLALNYNEHFLFLDSAPLASSDALVQDLLDEYRR